MFLSEKTWVLNSDMSCPQEAKLASMILGKHWYSIAQLCAFFLDAPFANADDA